MDIVDKPICHLKSDWCGFRVQRCSPAQTLTDSGHFPATLVWSIFGPCKCVHHPSSLGNTLETKRAHRPTESVRTQYNIPVFFKQDSTRCKYGLEVCLRLTKIAFPPIEIHIIAALFTRRISNDSPYSIQQFPLRCNAEIQFQRASKESILPSLHLDVTRPN